MSLPSVCWFHSHIGGLRPNRLLTMYYQLVNLVGHAKLWCMKPYWQFLQKKRVRWRYSSVTFWNPSVLKHMTATTWKQISAVNSATNWIKVYSNLLATPVFFFLFSDTTFWVEWNECLKMYIVCTSNRNVTIFQWISTHHTFRLFKKGCLDIF